MVESYRYRMNFREAFLLFKKAVLLVVLLVAVAAGAYMMRGPSAPVLPEPSKEERGAEAALPAYDREQPHVILRVRDVEGLRRGVGFFEGIMPDMSDPEFAERMETLYEDMDLPGGEDTLESLRQMSAAMAYIRFFDSFLTAADEFALLGTSADVCASFFTDETKYAALKSDPDGILSGASPWNTDLAGDGQDALTVTASLPAPGELEKPEKNIDVVFHVLKRAQGLWTQVLISSSEEGMRQLVRAWDEPSARAKTKRHLAGGNYLQYRMDVPTYAEGEARPIFAEVTWEGDGRTTRMDAFTDTSLWGAEPRTSGVEGEPVPLYGSGEPVALFTMDMAYIFSLAFPGADDPVGTFISLMEGSIGQSIPPQFAGDIRALLGESRVSFGCFMEKDQLLPSTAYALIEMKDPSVRDKYFSLASMMLQPAEVEGWERALKMEIDPMRRFVLLASGNRVLIGLGAPEAYAVRASLPAVMKDMPDKNVLSSFYFSTDILFDEASEVGKLLQAGMEENQELRETFEKLGLGVLSSFSGVQADVERSEARIVWREEK